MNNFVTTEAYKNYKDSGVDAIGMIPIHWEMRRFKFFLQEINIRSRTGEEPLLSLSKYKGVVPKDSLEERSGSAESLIGYKKVFVNDLVINKMQAVNGLLAISSLDGITSPDYSVYRLRNSNDMDFRYLGYLLSMSEYLGEFKKRVTGVMEGFIRLYTDDLFSIYSIVPPIEDQALIAKFLDKKTTQIDEAIAIKERQIALLKERKQIIIQKAVTQGLDPNVPMKDSGVDWIGEIPEHWEVVRFKNLFSQSRLPVRADDGVVTSYRDGQVTLRSNRRVDGYTEAIIEGGYQGIRKGQLVLNSMDAFEGAIGVSESDGKCTPEYVICDPNRNGVSQYYFAYLLREMALAKYIQVICNAVRQRAVRVRYNNLASRFMVLPPENEQLKIVRFIESEKINIDNGVEILQSQIEKLKEYKTTLINSAVTGKLKITPEMVGVREVAPEAVEG